MNSTVATSEKAAPIFAVIAGLALTAVELILSFAAAFLTRAVFARLQILVPRWRPKTASSAMAWTTPTWCWTVLFFFGAQTIGLLTLADETRAFGGVSYFLVAQNATYRWLVLASVGSILGSLYAMRVVLGKVTCPPGQTETTSVRVERATNEQTGTIIDEEVRKRFGSYKAYYDSYPASWKAYKPPKWDC